jgi:ABC-type uncharacterized transport system ATPase subunit
MQSQLELHGITKRFGSVVANSDITLCARPGEIHALVGENGAGKTTLMNILYGLIQPDKGEIRLGGRPVEIGSPLDAIQLGIGMVHQHFMLVPSLTVLENIVLGHPPYNRLLWRPQEARQIVSKIQEDFGLSVPLDAKVQELPVGLMQRVEILKVLYRGAEVLILDEPTATLTPQETDELFGTIKTLADKGRIVIFITHKLREVMTIADRVTVLRAGRTVGTVSVSETSPRGLARMMVGRELLGINKTEAAPRETVFEVEGLKVLDDRGLPAVRGMSFSLRKGEILGVAGVEGNGQRELVEALIGVRPIVSGTVRHLGDDVTKATAKTRRERGLGHVPEDRMRDALSLTCSITENIIMGCHDRPPLASGWHLDWLKANQYSTDLIGKFVIKANSPSDQVRVLSGGNMQKVVVARELSQNPKVLIVSQPTRGVDVGSAEYIHRALVDLRDAGVAVLLISAELDEILDLSDRIIVMYKGEIAGELSCTEATEENVGMLMFGTKDQEAREG